MASYSDEMKDLAQKLMGLISESLGLKGSYIEEAVDELYQNITISYYPPCPQPDLTLGLQPHSDMGAITLLIQDDVGGLEVLKDDQWITVDLLSDAILVILADQTEVSSFFLFLIFLFFFFNFWGCVLGSETIFLLFFFKTHLNLNSYNF